MSSSSYPLPQEMLAKWAAEIPNQVYLRQPVNRVYKEFTWSEVRDKMLRLAAAYRGLGLQPGDKISILGKNCAEWFIADFAASAAGLIPVPIYFTAGVKTINYVLEHSAAKAIVVGKLDSFDAANEALGNSGIIKIAMPYDTIACDHQLEDLIASNEPLVEVHQPELDDTFSISYTSGSTGNPKGAVITYKNIAYGAIQAAKQLGLSPDDRLISYLPLAHITERALIEHLSLYNGTTVTFVESLDTFAEDLRSARPSLFVSVPRLWMKFQAGVLAKMPQKKLNILLKIPGLNNVVRNKIKAQLGLDNARLCGSGTAPISPAVLNWYRSIGINISEGWGMTETTGLAVSNFPYRADKVGSIGYPVDGTEIKLSDQGEILVKSDGVIKEYYQLPDKTAETIIDGWLYTGDKAEVDADGYYRITGRVKDLFKTGKGKYCAPVPIESLLLENNLIEQICVMGSGLPQPVAVINLSAETTAGLSQGEISDSLAATLNKINQRIEAHEKLSHFVVAKDMWSIENALLTPTMKIKRAELEEKYSSLIESGSKDAVMWEA